MKYILSYLLLLPDSFTIRMPKTPCVACFKKPNGDNLVHFNDCPPAVGWRKAKVDELWDGEEEKIIRGVNLKRIKGLTNDSR